MNDSLEITYDAERLKALERLGLALPRPLGEPVARSLARLPLKGSAEDLAVAGLRGIEDLLESEEAYRACPLPERAFWSPIQSWAAASSPRSRAPLIGAGSSTTWPADG